MRPFSRPSTGGYTQTAGGRLAINKLGPVHDQLLIDGVANLGGTLEASGFPAVGGQSYTILTAADVNGVFATINAPAGMTVTYTDTSVILQSAPGPLCPADISPAGGDDAVNINDLLEVINGWGSCAVPCPPHCAADISPISAGDCAVNINDLLEVINSWGPCP